MVRLFRRILGQGTVTAVFQYPLDLTTFFLTSFHAMFLEGRRGGLSTYALVRRQIYFTTILGFPVVVAAGLSVGALIFIQAILNLPGFGAAQHVGPLSNSTLIREAAPFLTALIVIARSGTAISTELGNMKINREMELLESQGIHIGYFVVFPRIAGMAISMILLVLFFNVMGFIGGFAVTQILVPEASEYPLAVFVDEIHLSHISISLLKAVSFGTIIGTVCSYQGLQPSRSSTEVPQCATRAVVHSLALCILVNFFISIYI
ncbi:MAG: ABC transporter permease [Planctomycetota bacterium]|jgi:phospholipid/cholesterol/gamma-HCH transport system permease protein